MLLFNRYQYEPSTDMIGKGEFTRVYEALDTYIYLPVAVKVYRAIDSAEKFGFVHVEKIMGMDHPNICRYLHIGEIRKESSAGENEKMQVCVMELLQDGDFASYYQAHRSPELLRKMILDILHGLTYLHAQRIVHRRLKPSNMLVGVTTQGPVVKITDFGLGSGKATLRDARFSSMVVEVTDMAPEQFNPKEYGFNGNVTYHVDFWALGLAVYAALSDNDVLFKNSPGDSREQVIRNILSPRLPEKVLRLPAPFNRFVMRCLAKRAEDRPQNTRELIELLAEPITIVEPGYDEVVRGEPREDTGGDEIVTRSSGVAVSAPAQMTVAEIPQVE
ncbi:MAG TPA: protein kinase, partial [Puia sp.]|nr:protein kinase [Puia sp.]